VATSVYKNYENIAAAYGYGLVREGANAVLAVNARSVSRLRGLLLIVFSAIAGIFFLLLAVTSRNDRMLATAIFLFSLICVVGSVYLVKKIVVRTITFTPTALLVDDEGGEGHSFDLAYIESFSFVRETLKMKYGAEHVTVLRRIPHVARIQPQLAALLEEYQHLKS